VSDERQSSSPGSASLLSVRAMDDFSFLATKLVG
jgi:hypothetical protein